MNGHHAAAFDAAAFDAAAFGATRRSFLVQAGGVVTGLVLAGCGEASRRPRTQPLTGDLALVALASSLENLAVELYQTGLRRLRVGRTTVTLPDVPPSLQPFAEQASQQHAEHARRWNAVLREAGKEPVVGVNESVKKLVLAPMVRDVTEAHGLTNLFLELQRVMAATCLDLIGTVRDSSALGVASSVYPVEMQHAAVLDLMIGNFPVPRAFGTTAGSRPTSDVIS